MENITARSSRQLAAPLRTIIAGLAIVNLIVGLLFLFSPETGITLWPTAIAPVLSRFIGAIIIANGAGSWVVSRRGTWESARAIFVIGMVYGAIVLVALLYHLLWGGAAPILWLYAMLDAAFLGPIAYIYWSYEHDATSPASAPAASPR